MKDTIIHFKTEKTTKQKLEKLAVLDGRSLSNLLNWILKRFIKDEENNVL